MLSWDGGMESELWRHGFGKRCGILYPLRYDLSLVPGPIRVRPFSTLSPARWPVHPACPKPAPDGAECLRLAGAVQGAATYDTRTHVAATFLAIPVGYRMRPVVRPLAENS